MAANVRWKQQPFTKLYMFLSCFCLVWECSILTVEEAFKWPMQSKIDGFQISKEVISASTFKQDGWAETALKGQCKP